jgi:hypothetical protein
VRCKTNASNDVAKAAPPGKDLTVALAEPLGWSITNTGAAPDVKTGPRMARRRLRSGGR